MNYLQALSCSIIPSLQVQNPLILAGVATLLYWLLLSSLNSGAWKLRKFPTVGSSLPVLSLMGAIKYMQNTQNVVAIGRQKWPGRLFKVSSPTGWRVVITDPTHLDDLRKAPEHILSADRVVDETIQSQFTFDRRVIHNRIQVPIIKTRLTKEIKGLVADVYDEVVDACNQYLPVKDEWTSVTAFDNMTTIIARAANRVFVGPVLCRNPVWIKLCIGFTREVVKTAFLLRLFPSFLRPLVNYLGIGKVAQYNRDGLELLKPFIAARRDENGTKAETFNDFLSWLTDESKGEDREDWAISGRMFGLNFAAIHTSATAASHVLLDLASNPEYLKPLREEVEEVTKREGWTKAALDQMPKVDSFLKESQRLNPVGVLLMGRCAMVDYTFSDGTFIPAGTVLGVSTSSVQLDPGTYEDPLRFDGFRFVKMKERAAVDGGHPDRKFDMVTINSDFVAFGQGRHACPGRFFASAELKILLAYIVKTYDVKLVDDVRPPNLSRMNGILPDPAAKVYIRRRQ